MKMYKTKMIMVIVICMIMAVCAVGGMSILTANKILREKSETTLQLTSAQTGLRMNGVISNIQRSVHILARQSDDLAGNPDAFQADAAFVQNHAARMNGLMLTMAHNTPGCLAVYIRYNPDIASPTAGLFLVRDGEDGEFQILPPTDLSSYAENDREHVGWFYEPVKAKRALWMPPYENKNIHTYMVSYVVPLYVNGTNLGVVGMDIDYKYIQHMIRSISVYSTGYAFLTYGDLIMEHQSYPVYTPLSQVITDERFIAALTDTNITTGEYDYGGTQKSFAWTQLDNGMRLFICAPTSEIYADSRDLTGQIIFIACFSLLAIALISNYVIARIMKLAHIDELTCLSNRRGFMEDLNHHGLLEDYTYSLFLIDIDHFKEINDTFGHNNGDKALKNLAQALNCLGGDSLLARWGGDEFIGLIKTADAEQVLQQLVDDVASRTDSHYGRITISIGVQPILPDMTLTALTRGADAALYQSKCNGRNRLTIN